jgi:hypothetical protein
MSEMLRAVAEPTAVVADLSGRPVTVTVRVFNLSGIVDGYQIDAPAAPAWLRVEPADVRLLPGTDGEVEIPFAVLNADRVPAHDVEVRLRVRSIADPDVARSLYVTVSLPAVDADIALTLAPAMLHGNRAVANLTAHNRVGNVPVRLRLRGGDPEAVVRFEFLPQTLDLGPGDHGTAQVRLWAPPPRDGVAAQRQLTITASDGQRDFTTSGTLVQQPRRKRKPRPVRPVLRVLFTLLGAALLFGGTFMQWVGTSSSGADLTYVRYCQDVAAGFTLDCGQLPQIPAFMPTLLVSAGLVTVVLAVMALLGLTGTGALTRFAGIAAILFVLAVVFVRALAGANLDIGQGVLVIVTGGVVAVIGGVVARG